VHLLPGLMTPVRQVALMSVSCEKLPRQKKRIQGWRGNMETAIK